jgi:hypothetical protein
MFEIYLELGDWGLEFFLGWRPAKFELVCVHGTFSQNSQDRH